ncbi:hypothetical protein [Phenylobacterium sp.]|uniref:hypothetical protein n=1 Tax=Phenylobacterium sp. TaxID=1871053 RepID=UPI0025CE208E|nr:hypothetical protein [Phenylobacterium sp.]
MTPMKRIPLGPEASMGDFRRYPGCRFLITCALCSWSKDYNPERVIARLQELRRGGHATPIQRLARYVAWNCPTCSHVKWRAELAWPPGLTPGEVRRLTNVYRN